MSLITTSHLEAGGPQMRQSTHRVEIRKAAAATAINGLIAPHADDPASLYAGTIVMPEAGIVLGATACCRPLYYPEFQFIVQVSGMDGVLLRFDPDRGASFDVLFLEGDRWLCRHLAWRRRGGDLWLIPSAGNGPFVRACATGLEREDTPPFRDAEEREAGIIHAIESCSFEGRI